MTSARATTLVGYGFIGAAMAVVGDGWGALVAAALLALAISLIVSVTPRR